MSIPSNLSLTPFNIEVIDVDDEKDFTPPPIPQAAPAVAANISNPAAAQTARKIPNSIKFGICAFTATVITEVAGFPIIQEIAAESLVTITPIWMTHDLVKKVCNEIRSSTRIQNCISTASTAAERTISFVDSNFIESPRNLVQTSYRAVSSAVSGTYACVMMPINGVKNAYSTAKQRITDTATAINTNAINLKNKTVAIATNKNVIACTAAMAGTYAFPNYQVVITEAAAAGLGIYHISQLINPIWSSYSLKKMMRKFEGTPIYNKIVESYEKKLENLDLSGQIPTDFPLEALQYLSHLKKLNLSNNDLKQIPSELSVLTQLQELNLSRNSLQEIPVAMVALKLTKLDLSVNPLKNFPLAVSGMTSLTDLRMAATQISELNIRKLEKLQHLDVMCNNIERLSRDIFKPYSKLDLCLAYNPLADIPSIKHMKGTIVLPDNGNRKMVAVHKDAEVTFVRNVNVAEEEEKFNFFRNFFGMGNSRS